MAQTIAIALRSYNAQSLTLPPIDNIPANAIGAEIRLTRGAAGTWPATSAMTVVTMWADYLIGGVWQPAAKCTFCGGQTFERDGSLRLVDVFSIYFPKDTVNGELQIVKPEAIQFRADILQTIQTGVNAKWLP